MNNVICVKWGTKYGPEYVNILAAMVRRHLQTPYRFVCFTDDSTGFDPRIEVRPLPEITLSNHFPLRAWRKQTVFREKLDDLEGTALFLDLDVVILSDLQPLFDHPGKFLIIHEWGFRDPVIGNSSVFRFEIGQHADQLDYFVNNTDEVRGRFRNEQAYTSHSMHDKGILEYWPKEWCLSFKRHCMRSFPINYFLPPEKPENAKIVIFHGKPNPDDARDGWTGHYGLRRVLPTKWIGEAWRE